MIIVLKGKLKTLDTFAEALAKDSDAIIVDVTNPEEKILPVFDLIDDKTTVIAFNNIGAGFTLWKQRNVRLYNIVVDHPAYYLNNIESDYYDNYHVLCIDRKHRDFLKKTYPTYERAFNFLPHGGIDIGGMHAKKDIDILYVGGFRPDEDINFALLPFGDTEEFFDFIISYYDTESYVEAYDAVNAYCQKYSYDYSKEQKAIMTNYVLQSVEYYFTAKRRKELISYLAECGLKIHICGTPLWKEIAGKYRDSIIYEGFKTPIECLEFISRAKVLVNDLPYFSEGAHERVFNGMLNGAVVLTNESRYLEERFNDRENILFWDGRSYALAAEKIVDILKNDEHRIGVINNAYSLVRQDTWQDRLRMILSERFE